jgi:DNA-binding response OmpR family regulator
MNLRIGARSCKESFPLDRHTPDSGNGGFPLWCEFVNGELPMRTCMSTRRVLFVDDDAVLSKMFVDLLSGSGYHTRAAETGAEALRQLVEFQPQLVVLDIGLPDISGLEILRQIKTNPSTRKVPVILITGTSGLEMKIEGFQTGANDYLSKPINLRELLLRVERCFSNLKDEEAAVTLMNREMLQSILTALGQGITAPLSAIRNEVRLSEQEEPGRNCVERMKRIDGFVQQAEQVLIKLRSALNHGGTEVLRAVQELEPFRSKGRA